MNYKIGDVSARKSNIGSCTRDPFLFSALNLSPPHQQEFRLSQIENSVGV